MVSIMKFKVVLLFVTVIFCSVTSDVSAQFSWGFGGSSYYFVNSRDDNVHIGPQLRFCFDRGNTNYVFGASYFLPVISSVPFKAFEYDLSTNLPASITLRNQAEAYSVDVFGDFHYYLYGMPIDGRGVYAIGGIGAFFYNQTYNLSNFNEDDYTTPYLDGANYYSTQLIVDLGLGAKLPMRKKSWYIEMKFNFLTDPYKDYERAVQGSHYLSLNTGIVFHSKTRKNKYQRMAMGRKKKTRRKSVSRIRR